MWAVCKDDLKDFQRFGEVCDFCSENIRKRPQKVHILPHLFRFWVCCVCLRRNYQFLQVNPGDPALCHVWETPAAITGFEIFYNIWQHYSAIQLPSTLEMHHQKVFFPNLLINRITIGATFRVQGRWEEGYGSDSTGQRDGQQDGWLYLGKLLKRPPPPKATTFIVVSMIEVGGLVWSQSGWMAESNWSQSLGVVQTGYPGSK